MDFVKPAEVLQSMVEAGENKARMNRVQMLIRGSLAGAILAFATTLATLIQTSEAKTLGYQHLGGAGIVLVIIKAVLCNWMVTLGAVLAMTSTSTSTSTSTLGKIVAMWLPITIFFAQLR